MTETDCKRLTTLLSQTFLFFGISPAAIHAQTPFFADCMFLSFTAGSTIQSAQMPVSGIAVIETGHAAVLSAPSETAVCLRSIGPGNIFGAASLYTENQSYETVIRAVSDCTVLLIPEQSVKRLIRSYGEIAENYIRFLSGRICFLNQKITAFTAGSAEAKLAVFLSGLLPDPSGTLTLTTSLSALADSLGMGRASLYRALEKYEQSGIIKRDGKKIHVLDKTALHAAFRNVEY